MVETSDWGDILSEVVQGSILGPVLFLCFINDLDLAVDMVTGAGGQDKLNILKKFADDTKWGRVVESAEDRVMHNRINLCIVYRMIIIVYSIV